MSLIWSLVCECLRLGRIVIQCSVSWPSSLSKSGKRSTCLPFLTTLFQTDDWHQKCHTIQKLCILCAFALAPQPMGRVTWVCVSSSSATFDMVSHSLSLHAPVPFSFAALSSLHRRRERSTEIPFRKVFENHCYCCAREKFQIFLVHKF